MAKKESIPTIPLEELREGSSMFESKGTSYIKVTHDGEVKRLAIPIKSSGVSELVDEFNRQAPQAPKIFKVVRPNDEAYSELKLTKKQHVQTFDLTDPDYIEALEKHTTNLGLKIVLKGMNMPIRDKEGKDIEDDDRKIEVLRSMGISGEQFTQLVEDISSLTKWQEDRDEDFLPD